MEKKLLILSSVWLEPNSSAAGSRMLQLIAYFQSKNYAITYASTAQSSEFAEDLSTLKIKSQNIKINHPDFDTFLIQENPQIVLFDRFMVEEQFGWRVQETLPNAIRILDTEDLHCLRKTRQEAYKKNKAFTKDLLLNSEIAKREIASIFRCDLSLIISDYEMKLLQQTFKVPSNILIYLPFLLEELSNDNFTGFNERNHFYFIGNNRHQPNVATILILKKYWKAIAAKLPKSELHIYGAYPTQQILQLHQPKERFFIKGRLQDKSVLKKYRVLLAPIPFGAGLKGKFIEAMQNGTPSITTKIGAEGMRNNLDWCGFITENDSDFIEKSIQLYSDIHIWNDAQNKGKAILDSNFNKRQFIQEFDIKLNNILNDIQTHRNQNFIGQMLGHHTLKSLKYLAKWIEEKNKK